MTSVVALPDIPASTAVQVWLPLSVDRKAVRLTDGVDAVANIHAKQSEVHMYVTEPLAPLTSHVKVKGPEATLYSLGPRSVLGGGVYVMAMETARPACMMERH